MDPKRFDLLTRRLGDVSSRRTLLGTVAAIAASPLVADARRRGRGPAPEGPCGNGSRTGNLCASADDCCTGICANDAGKANKDGQGRCRCVRAGGSCTEDRNCCNRRGQQMTCNPVVNAQSGKATTEKVCGRPPTCDATTCPAGCCSSGTCIPYASQTVSACGAAGATCAACPGSGSLTCTNGVCGDS